MTDESFFARRRGACGDRFVAARPHLREKTKAAGENLRPLVDLVGKCAAAPLLALLRALRFAGGRRGGTFGRARFPRAARLALRLAFFGALRACRSSRRCLPSCGRRCRSAARPSRLARALLGARFGLGRAFLRVAFRISAAPSPSSGRTSAPAGRSISRTRRPLCSPAFPSCRSAAEPSLFVVARGAGFRVRVAGALPGRGIRRAGCLRDSCCQACPCLSPACRSPPCCRGFSALVRVRSGASVVARVRSFVPVVVRSSSGRSAASVPTRPSVRVRSVVV